jgi:hypothetical protein
MYAARSMLLTVAVRQIWGAHSGQWPRRIEKKGWVKTLIEIKPEEYEGLRSAPPLNGSWQRQVEEDGPNAEALFPAQTFDLLAGLHADTQRD